MTYIIRAASMEDAATIAPLLREADKNEIAAIIGWPPLNAVEYSLVGSDEAWFVTRPDGQPILIAGVGQDIDGQGVPWMVGTPLVKHYGKSLIKVGREWVKRWTKKYGYLSNFVDARNTTHVEWLARMGFTIEDADHFVGHDPDIPFLFFYRSN